MVLLSDAGHCDRSPPSSHLGPASLLSAIHFLRSTVAEGLEGSQPFLHTIRTSSNTFNNLLQGGLEPVLNGFELQEKQ